MNRLLEAQTEQLEKIRKLAEAQTDKHHRRILESYLRHVALEIGFGPRWEDIFSDELTVRHPVYHVQLEGATKQTTFDGEEAVKDFYRSMVGKVKTTNEFLRLAVADWGVAIMERWTRYINGTEARELGLDVDDENATYGVPATAAMYWRYDEEARLEGEDVWVIEGGNVINKVAPEDVFTEEEMQEVLRPYQGAPTIRR